MAVQVAKPAARSRRWSGLGAVLTVVWRVPRTRAGIVMTTTMVLVALVGPWLAPHGLQEFVDIPFSPSARGAPLGTDFLGHDVISQALYGGRSIVWMAFATTTLGVGLGVVWGVAASYGGGWVEDALMRLADVVYAIPVIVLVLVVLSVAPSSRWLIVVLISIGWAPQVARVARGATGGVVNREFVEFARLIGIPAHRVIRREILPNIMTPLLVEYGLRLTWSIGAIAGIGFLGFGAQPPATDWGIMINQNRQGLTTAPWGTLLPCLLIGVLTVGTNLIAEGLARSLARDDTRGS
jgi:peptide/nickel transport system permease protein